MKARIFGTVSHFTWAVFYFSIYLIDGYLISLLKYGNSMVSLVFMIYYSCCVFLFPSWGIWGQRLWFVQRQTPFIPILSQDSNQGVLTWGSVSFSIVSKMWKRTHFYLCFVFFELGISWAFHEKSKLILCVVFGTSCLDFVVFLPFYNMLVSHT